MSSQHANPVMLTPDGHVRSLTRLALTATPDGVLYDEAYLEELLYRHPEALPIREIDTAYLDPVPICTQLSTRVGQLDVLYVTPEGRLVIVEAKLWRNPEQRRKVVAQIIDYAAELSRWTFDDLEREVSKRIGGQRQSLFERVARFHPDIVESEFVDSVSRTLREGRFLLLMCGDGVREELASITEFLSKSMTLDLTFGLLELAIFATDEGGRLILPRVLAKTMTIGRQVLRIEGGSASLLEEGPRVTGERAIDVGLRAEPSEQQQTYVQFWADLAANMRFDDSTQTPITLARAPNTTLRMPSPRTWITIYFAASSGTMGVFLTFNRGEPGDTFYRRLLDEKAAVSAELPPDTVWSSDGSKHQISCSRPLNNLLSDASDRSEAILWFSHVANAFVNAFRHRIARFIDEL